VRARIEIPDTAIERVALATLPKDFAPDTAYTLTQAFGDRWIREERSAVLVVPSAIVPLEHNVLLNPAHPDFVRCNWGRFEEVQLDPRLWAVT
jgi:RES domain-containing protein